MTLECLFKGALPGQVLCVRCSSVLSAATNGVVYKPRSTVAAEPVGSLGTCRRGARGGVRDMEPGEAGTRAANGEKGGATEDAASGEDQAQCHGRPRSLAE